MIYQVTYVSDGLMVKGYLGLPGGYRLNEADLEKLLCSHFGLSALPVAKIADSVQTAEQQDLDLDKLPVLVYCRGGIGKVGRVKTHWIEQFANFGYVVFAPCYRGNEGGEGRDEFGGGENEDVLSAIRFLQSLPFVNTERVTVLGFSRGSINASRTAVEMAGILKLILWSGISDLAQTYEERVDLRRMLKRVIGANPAKDPDAYRRRSSIHLAEGIRCPVLVMHGTEDPQVDFSHGLKMYNRLKQLDADVELHTYEGYAHLFPPEIHQLALLRMFDWVAQPPESE